MTKARCLSLVDLIGETLRADRVLVVELLHRDREPRPVDASRDYREEHADEESPKE